MKDLSPLHYSQSTVCVYENQNFTEGFLRGIHALHVFCRDKIETDNLTTQTSHTGATIEQG